MPTARSCAVGFLGSTIEPASAASTPASEALHGSDSSNPSLWPGVQHAVIGKSAPNAARESVLRSWNSTRKFGQRPDGSAE